MNSLNFGIVCMSLAGVSLAIGCSSSDTSVVAPGTERGTCRDGTECDPGLICLTSYNVCVRPAEGGVAGAPNNGGAGGTSAATGGSPNGGAGTMGRGGAGGGSMTTGGSATDGAAGGAGQSGGDASGGNQCGDLVCDPGECSTCSPDCGPTCTDDCGNGTCDQSEDCMSCPADCQTGCGDGCCLINENCQTCPQDCVTVESCDPSACGNNQCNYGLSETCLNCADCYGLCDCGDDNCVSPETTANCPWDC